MQAEWIIQNHTAISNFRVILRGISLGGGGGRWGEVHF